MPFIPNTPESLLGRSDSKNPDTTCRGITSSGRPCRRPLGSSPSSTLSAPPSRRNKLRADDPSDPNLYCWQHRDQASHSARSSPGPRTSTTPILEARESLDTLADRLGIIEASQQTPSRKPRRGAPTQPNPNLRTSEKPPQPPKRKTKSKNKTFCFCFTIPVLEEERPARPKPRPLQPNATSAAVPGAATRPQSTQHLSPSPSRPRPSIASSKHSSAQSHTSQTAQYLSLIPASASPQTASLLLAELAKPISQQDEPGYIYMFWLTPESQPKTPLGASESLLAPPSRPGTRQRRPSDVLESFANKAASTQSTRSAGAKKTILLKIGRASNVQRRLNEWSRQCGYDLSLIRYYPYISSSSFGVAPRKVPHSHKVERLIHLELAGAGLRLSDRENCEACGKAHREWFEVDAGREAVMMVDAAVKRWVDWDESNGRV